MSLHAKWMICLLIFIFIAGVAAWSNYLIQTDRPNTVNQSPESEGTYRGLTSPENDMSLVNYKPREYVKIVRKAG
ncbi:hypothetical protein B1748_34540 [Paenibacillus sp. MY03]|uniref:hypothetical protein n=1 Tax=Paenibacillus sp. MY03 TaxID=302980 RepID=UPI000B3D0839|nr:hypothetical protein [Paenibacillus sp. MY03]OUS68180.1 hypothetical protein B1748_34540 [Paenibacillus sp. MY03]